MHSNGAIREGGDIVKWTIGVALFLGLLVLGCVQNNTYPPGSTTNNYVVNPPASTSGNGRLVLVVTDAATNMENISRIQMTIDRIEVHSATEGWTTLSTNPQTYDLLALKAQGKWELAADAEIKEGTYNMIRMQVSNVTVTDNSGPHTAKLPSGELKIANNINVTAGRVSTVGFDFIADESLHLTGNGQYIFAPVIQIEARENATVSVDAENAVQVQGGSITSSMRVGTDVEGNTGIDIRIPANAMISINGDTIIIETDTDSNTGTNVNVNIGIGGNATTGSGNASGSGSVTVGGGY